MALCTYGHKGSSWFLGTMWKTHSFHDPSDVLSDQALSVDKKNY